MLLFSFSMKHNLCYSLEASHLSTSNEYPICFSSDMKNMYLDIPSSGEPTVSGEATLPKWLCLPSKKGSTLQ